MKDTELEQKKVRKFVKKAGKALGKKHTPSGKVRVEYLDYRGMKRVYTFGSYQQAVNHVSEQPYPTCVVYQEVSDGAG